MNVVASWRPLALAGLLIACLVLGAARAGAQSSTSAEETREPRMPTLAPLAGAVDPAHYRLGPGDALRLALYGPLSRQITLVVTPEGTLFLPEVGSLRVSGLTLTEARQLVTSRIKGALRGVGVEFQLIIPRTFRVYLTGELRISGPRLASATSRLADVLPESLLVGSSSRRRIEVRSLDGSRWIGDLERFRLAGESRSEHPLADGDVIQVPVATQFIAALGGVGRPGRYELGFADSLATLLELSGGLQRDAISERALLVRWQGVQKESLWVALDDPSAAGLRLPLRDGDELHVFTRPDYHISDCADVSGRVAVTGNYPIRSGVTRLSQIIVNAGGLLPDADSASVLLFRARPASGPDLEFDRLSRLSRSDMTASEYETFRTRLAALSPDFRVDMRRLRANGVSDLLLMNGDHIVVSRVVRSIRVDGQVRRPGVLNYEPGKPWTYYVRMAGGFTARSSRSQVRLTRASSGQTLLAKETGAPLAGDFLWVPERPDVPGWAYLRDTILVLAQVATVIIAVRK